MQANRSKNTKPEMVLRRLLHKLGYRYSLHRRDLPGTPDLVFRSRKSAIQVHGCFWHQHEGCRLAHAPKTRLDYWQPKLARNQERDLAAREKLKSMGWQVITIWECELAYPDQAVSHAVAFLGPSKLPEQAGH
jgi:DNA mismatch endonuclease, patch repair protein